MNELQEKLIKQVVEALKNATPNQIYLILRVTKSLTRENRGD